MSWGRTRVIGLALHAERLYDRRTWPRVERVARSMARWGMRATFFVYPFRAQVAGKEIGDRVRALAAMGHEIGQHTHFYAGTKIEKPDKANDFSEENIARCLRRDFETLQAMGTTPQGFTAGAWMVNEIVWDELIEMGFAYDCSARFPKPTGITDVPYHRWRSSSEVYANGRGSLQLLPTTCSLGEWFRWGRRLSEGGSTPYQLIYLHDYDLLAPRAHYLLWLFLFLNRRADDTSAGRLAQPVGTKGAT